MAPLFHLRKINPQHSADTCETEATYWRHGTKFRQPDRGQRHIRLGRRDRFLRCAGYWPVRACTANKYPDLKEQYDVRLEQGLDAFVVADGLPVVPKESKPKLIKFLTKQLNKAGKVKEDGFVMPVNKQGMTEGYGQ